MEETLKTGSSQGKWTIEGSNLVTMEINMMTYNDIWFSVYHISHTVLSQELPQRRWLRQRRHLHSLVRHSLSAYSISYLLTLSPQFTPSIHFTSCLPFTLFTFSPALIQSPHTNIYIYIQASFTSNTAYRQEIAMMMQMKRSTFHNKVVSGTHLLFPTEPMEVVEALLLLRRKNEEK